MLTKSRVVYLGNLVAVAKQLAAMPDICLVGWIAESEDRNLFGHTDLEGLPKICWIEDHTNLLRALDELLPLDLGVIANFGTILSPQHLQVPRCGFINAHPGLLPDYPGRHPLRNALANQEPVTGVTLHWVTERIDAGPVIAKRVISMGADPKPDEVSERLIDWSCELLWTNLPSLLRSKQTIPA